MANSYDFSIEQGSSFNLSLTTKDQCGVPLNLSGYGARGGMKYSYGYTGYLLNLNPYITSGAGEASGIINIALSAAETSSLPISKAVYDIEVYSPSGYTFKAIRGYIEVIPEASTL